MCFCGDGEMPIFVSARRAEDFPPRRGRAGWAEASPPGNSILLTNKLDDRMKRTMHYLTLLKRALPVMAFVGAGLMTACEKTPEQTPALIDPVKVLKFGDRDIGYDSIGYDNVMKYANDPHITKIIYFMDSTNDNNNYTGYSSENISQLRGILQERLDYTTKATGAGVFEFRRSQLHIDDSLWFVANGWKIRTWQR